MNILHEIAGYFQYNLFGLVYLTAGFFNLSIGLVILSKDRWNLIHRAFFYVTATAFIWSVSIGMLNLTADPNRAHLWLRTQYFFGVPFISPTVYLFSLRWTKKGHPFALRMSFICAFIAMSCYCFFPDRFWIVRDRAWGRYPSYIMTAAGKVLITFLLSYFFVYAFLAFRNFYRGWRQSENPRERAQFRNILIGFSLAYIGSIDFVAAFDIEIIPFGFVPLALLMVIVAYTMLKYEFLDVNLILKKSFLLILIYSLLFTITLPIAIPLALKFSRNPTDNPVFTVLSLGLGVGIILSLGPIIYAYLARRNFWLKETVSTGLTHELKSPIGAIRGAIDLLSLQLKTQKDVPPHTTDYISMIDRNTARLEVFVHDLLVIAKGSDASISVSPVRINFSELVMEISDIYEPVFQQKGIKLEPHVPTGLIVFGEPEKLKQVISNLLSNALKFSKEGAVSITLIPKDKFIHCTIEDNGAGIARDKLERVFDRFYQGKNSKNGSGIGLTIAKTWVEAHGGKIWAESEGEGKGTKMIFQLPI